MSTINQLEELSDTCVNPCTLDLTPPSTPLVGSHDEYSSSPSGSRLGQKAAGGRSLEKKKRPKMYELDANEVNIDEMERARRVLALKNRLYRERKTAELAQFKEENIRLRAQIEEMSRKLGEKDETHRRTEEELERVRAMYDSLMASPLDLN